jgi:ribose/xylose/arabinose/galactoside ABC-type transport system permease subunit
MAALAALLALAVLTPGFLTRTSLLALLTTVSFIGCVAVGMTFITLSGNIMSFSLGATLSAGTIVLIACLPYGLGLAILSAAVFCALLSGIQGWIIGYFRANPIIVSMASLALLTGVTTYLTGGRGVYPRGTELEVLTRGIGPIPGPLAALLCVVLIGQFILSRTRFGRNLYLVGSNFRAARAAGMEPWKTIALAYLIAGLFTAVSAVLIAARYSSGDMEHGIGYDYQAISAVLVGGTAIQGGKGSVLRTLSGAFLIAVIQGLLLIRGFSTQMQYLLIGIVVLAAIMLQSKGEA